MIKIVAINSKYVQTLLSPYYLKENCDFKNEVQIVQCNINQNLQDIYQIAIANDPKIIALPCYIFNINCVLQLIDILRKNHPNIIIVLGGPEVSFENEYLLHKCDFIITGEGERCFNQLINDLVANNYDKSQLNKIYAQDKNLDFSAIKSPYSDDYFEDTKGKIAYFEGSRGCPFSCAYCMSGIDGLRCFTLEHIKDELNKFKGKNIRVLKFVDRTFNANKALAKDILRFLINNKNDFSFPFHFEIAADILDDEFIDIVAKSDEGFFQFEVGVQSFNTKTLAEVVRKTNLDKVVSNLKKLIATKKSHIHTDLIAGLPYEDYESFKDGFNKLYAVKSHMLQLGFLKVLKGSRLKQTLTKDYVYDSNPPYEIKSTPYISEDELLKLKYVEDACDKYYNSGRFKKTLDKFVIVDPFDFYFELGKMIFGKNLSLFDKIEILYDFLCKKFDSELVKSIMTIDYMETNNSRILPNCLKFEYNKDFAKLLRRIGADKKKYFVVRSSINPYDYSKGDYLFYVDYSKGYNVEILNLDEVKCKNED